MSQLVTVVIWCFACFSQPTELSQCNAACEAELWHPASVEPGGLVKPRPWRALRDDLSLVLHEGRLARLQRDVEMGAEPDPGSEY